MFPTLSSVRGCLLGLALGDAMGAPFEGGVLERALWRVIGTTRGLRRWTDDTQMSLDTAESLMAQGGADADDLAKRYAQSYRWSRGYGPAAAKVLGRIRGGMHWSVANTIVHADGSFGNGAAMRAPIVGIAFADNQRQRAEATIAQARVTHAHPLGVEGAMLIADATARVAQGDSVERVLAEALSCCQQPQFVSRLKLAEEWIGHGHAPSSKHVAQQLGRGIAAHESCVTAVYLLARFRDQSFHGLIEFVSRMGGDADTIAAMAGALWGAARGVEALPEQELARLEDRARIAALADALHTWMQRV
jgi:poly(ADP-ribose) glycohydrolase ARH3